MNQGIWFLKDGDDEVVLKLVKFDPSAPAQLVETEVLQKLHQEIPEIVSDPSIAFPIKILKIVDGTNVRHHDLHVMRRLPGRSFDSIIESYWKGGRKYELMVIFKRIGEFLGRFHDRYGGRKHNDAGPQNIFYDEVSEQVAFVDVGLMGNNTLKNDVEVFSGFVTILSRSYGAELLQGLRFFEHGYDEARTRKGVRRGGA
jgi:Ser/Thr protein kinase RdoA (MazF antagonist)